MASLVLAGDTSGSVTVTAPAVAGSNTQTLVATTGTLAPIVSGTAQASTSGTSIDFTGIPSWVKRITVMFDGVSLSGTDNIIVQIGPSGAVETTSYISSSTQTTGAAGGTAGSTAGFIVRCATAANLCYGHMIITNITSNTWISSHALSADGSTSGMFGGGTKALASGPLARLSITRTGTNTFDAGTINILYE
jgi:hypothetical protein